MPRTTYTGNRAHDHVKRPRDEFDVDVAEHWRLGVPSERAACDGDLTGAGITVRAAKIAVGIYGGENTPRGLGFFGKLEKSLDPLERCVRREEARQGLSDDVQGSWGIGAFKPPFFMVIGLTFGTYR